MQVIIMVFGSRDAKYFSYDGPDGFKTMRYVSSLKVEESHYQRKRFHFSILDILCLSRKETYNILIGVYNSWSLDIQLSDSLYYTWTCLY